MKSLKFLTTALLIGLLVFLSEVSFAQNTKAKENRRSVITKMKEGQRVALQAKIAAKKLERAEVRQAKMQKMGVERKEMTSEARAALRAKINAKMQNVPDPVERRAEVSAKRAAARQAARQAFQKPTSQEKISRLFQSRQLEK